MTRQVGSQCPGPGPSHRMLSWATTPGARFDRWSRSWTISTWRGQRFLECGGFPRAVGEVLQTGGVSTEFVFDLMAWMIGDVDAGGPPDSVARLLHELLTM